LGVAGASRGHAFRIELLGQIRELMNDDLRSRPANGMDERVAIEGIDNDWFDAEQFQLRSSVGRPGCPDYAPAILDQELAQNSTDGTAGACDECTPA
jgi:hypothetical protein